ncbi:acyl-CoA dehydrogenase family protein [Nocardia gamkensis]|uniref:acyl-CoA dehydrogenase family protein n=1 Tax=Nocardia gamkensis TaxID=352869 RepID=UPI0036E62EEC
MDFNLDPQQQAVADVLSAVLEKHSDADDLWEQLVAAGVTTLAVPEEFGGDGAGLLETATALTELGRRAAITPALASLGMATGALVRCASAEQQQRYFEAVGRGAIVTAALNEPSQSMPSDPATRLADGRINGTKVAVPYADRSEWMIVTTDVGAVCIPADASGVHWSPTPSATGAPEFTVRFIDTPVADQDVLAHPRVDEVNDVALAMAGAYGSGLMQGALRLTADYLAGRHQFGKPLTTFQLVAAQLADVYIASRTVDLASKSAVYRLASGGEARDDLAVLGYWFATEAPQAMQLCHHLHGGIGVDITYPMARYYAATKDLVRLIGGSAHRLDIVGAPCL